MTDKGFLKILGERIKTLRNKKNLTQLELAVQCNNHAEQIGRIERGELNVSICSLFIIANGLEVPLKELLDFQYPEKKETNAVKKVR